MAFINPYLHKGGSLSDYKAAMDRGEEARKEAEAEAEGKDAPAPLRAMHTVGDLGGNVIEGAGRAVEGIFDMVAGVVGGIGGLFSKDFREGVQDVIEFDATSWAGNEIFNRAHKTIFGTDIAEYSYLKENGMIEQIAQGVGAMLPAVAVSVATAGAGAPAAVSQVLSMGTMAAGAAGQATQEAYQDGAGYYQGLAYGAIRGGTEVATEKLFGGLDVGLFGKGFLPDVAKSVADTGVKRFVKGALQEGAEEMVSELADPAARSVYQGKEAYKKYLDPAFYGDVAKAGVAGTATGAVFSGTVGRAMSGGSVAEDVQSVMTEVDTLERKRRNLFANDQLTDEADTRIGEDIRENYRVLEGVLKKAPESKRAAVMEQYELSRWFDEDGVLKPEFSARLDTRAASRQTATEVENGDPAGSAGLTGRFDRRYHDPDAEDASIDTALSRKGRAAFAGELSKEGKARYRSLKKVMNTFSRVSGDRLHFVIAEESPDTNAYYDPDTDMIVIGADVLEQSDDSARGITQAWFEATLHEVTHATEGTAAYRELSERLEKLAFMPQVYEQLAIRGYFDNVNDELGARLNALLSKESLTEAEQVEVGELSRKVKAALEERIQYLTAKDALTAEEEAELSRFLSESTAIMAERVLNSESFVRRLVREDAVLVEKLLIKIADIKEAMVRVGDKVERDVAKEIKAAEDQLLRAVSEAGYRFDGGKIVGAEEEEKQESVKYSIKRPKFTQDDIQRNMEVIAGMDAVMTIGAEKLEKTGKRPKDMFLEFFESLGNNITSPIYGDIALSNASAKSEIRHGVTAEKIASIEAIPAVIEKGEVIFHRVKPDSDVERIVICAPIKIGVEDYYMGVMLQRDTQSQRLYLHSVASLSTKEEATASSQADRVTNGALEDDNHLFMTSILQKAVDVKQNLKNSSVKESRKPKSQTSGNSEKEKAPDWFTNRGLQLPKLVQTISDADNSIPENSENVKAFDEKSSVRESRKAKSQASGASEAPDVSLTGMQRQIVAAHSRPKVYTRAEAVSVIDDVVKLLEEAYNEEGGIGEGSGYVTLKKKVTEAAAETLWKSFNKATMAKERAEIADKLADAIMKETMLVTVASDEALGEARSIMDTLRYYIRKIDLSGITSEIKSRGLDEKAVRGRWGARKGETSFKADQIKGEIESALGMTIPYEHEADIFFWIDEQFKQASDVIKVTNTALLSGNGVLIGEDKTVREKIAKEILQSFKNKGKPSEWTKRLLFEIEPGYDGDAASVGITKAKFDAAKALNFGRLNVRAAFLASGVKDWKAGVFLNQSQPKYQNIFNDTIGQLSKINKGGRMLDPVKTRELIAKLGEWYTEENMKFMGVTFEQEISQYIKTIAEGEGALSVGDLQYLVNIMEYMKYTAEHYGKVWKNGRMVDALPEAQRYVKILKNSQRLRVGFMDSLYSSAYMRMYGDPHMLVRYMDKYQRGFYTEMFERLRDGAVSAHVNLMKMQQQIDETMAKYPKYFKELEKRKIHLHGADMPVADAMSLYLSLFREQAVKGLLENGYCFRDDDPKQTTRRVFGLTGGENVWDENGQVLPKYKKMIESLQEEIFAQLSKADQAYMGIVIKLMGDDCKRLKRDTDMLRMGYSNAVESFYFPIRRAYTAQDPDQQKFTNEINRVSNASFNKNTERGAANQLLIEPIQIVLNRHMRGVTMYAGLGRVLDDFKMLKNLNTDENYSNNKPVSIASEEENTWLAGRKYFEKLIADIQGIRPDTDELTRLIGKIRGNYAKFALAANPKVIMTQLSSVFAASNLLDYGSLVKGFGERGRDVFDFCELAELRAYENQAAMAQGLLDEAGDKLMKPIGWMDSFVVRRLFVACQHQVAKDRHLTLGTPENKQAAGELLREVILETQQNALAIEKSEAARSTSEIQKMITMFTSDAVKLMGRVLDAFGEVSVIKRAARVDGTSVDAAAMKSAQKRLGRALGSLGAVAIYTMLLSMGVKWFLNKDDEEMSWTDWLSCFFGTLLGGLPIISDAYDRFFGSGYGLEDMSISAVNDIMDSFSDFFNAMGAFAAGDLEGREAAKTARSMLYSFGQVSGIPIRNVYNWSRGVLDKFSSDAVYKLDNAFYKQSYNADIKAAIEAEDEDRLATVVGVMLDENVGEVTSSAVRQEMNRLVIAGMDVLPRGVGDTVTYEGQSVKLTAKQKARFREVYGEANEAVSRMVTMKLYATATDEAKAKAIKRLYGIYYNRAIEDLLGVSIENKNVLMSRAVDPAQLSIIAAVCAGLTADVGKDGKAVSGSKKAKVVAYLNSLNLKAAQKHLILGYLGYKNTLGEEKVRAYLAGLGLGKGEVEEMMRIGGY